MSDTREALRRLGAPMTTPRQAFEQLRDRAMTCGRRIGRPGELVTRSSDEVRRALSRLTADDVNHDTRDETFLAYITPPSLAEIIARRR